MVTKRLQCRYDAVGNKVGMTDADGGLFTYTYDVMRRLTGVINPVGERTTYTYDLNGRRTSAQLANGTRTSYSYDQGSRVQQIHTLKSNNSTVAKFDYAYDDNGRRTSVLEADGSRVTWTYDGTSQVTSEWRTGTSPFRHTFVYDTRGNRTLKVEDGARTTLVYDVANQLSSSEDVGGTTNYTYDGNGNQHVTVVPSGSRTTQIWDYENRLVKTLQPGGGVSTMAYDADGLRVRKETPSEAKLFVWDDQNYLAETDDSGVTEVAYTMEPSTYGSTISHWSGGATTTYHFDALAAARVLTNASETVLESYNYTAFGTILGTPTLLTPFLWGGLVGYYWDSDLATQYIRARHYQPSIARWISLDPIGFAGGDTNLFRYVGNSPTSGTDPSGNQQTDTFAYELNVKTVFEKLENLKCGEMADMHFLFRLRSLNPRKPNQRSTSFNPKGLKGYFIQKVEVDCSISACPDPQKGEYVPADDQHGFFYEMWEVSWDDKGIISVTNEKQFELGGPGGPRFTPPATDRATAPAQEGTYGSAQFRGEIRFFASNAKRDTELQTWTGQRGAFGTGYCGVNSGKLPGSSTAPTFWNESGGWGQKVKPGFRGLAIVYNCCECPSRRKVQADGFPRRGQS